MLNEAMYDFIGLKSFDEDNEWYSRTSIFLILELKKFSGKTNQWEPP